MTAFGKFWRPLVRLLRQAIFPLLLSAGYASLVYSGRPEGAPITDLITPFAGAFFFSMWLLGQFLRTSKQISDADNFSMLSTGIEEIRATVAELLSRPIESQAASDSHANNLIQQAKEIASQGAVLAALLQAGLAFDQAVHEKAKRIGLDVKQFRGIQGMLAEIERQIGPGAQRELTLLWKLRNQIVHADQDASRKLQGQPELVSMFEQGIRLLDAQHDAL